MKSIEELYDEVREKFPDDSLQFVWHIVCRKYAKQAIERAAEKATTKEIPPPFDEVVVDKQSILSVIEEMK